MVEVLASIACVSYLMQVSTSTIYGGQSEIN